MQNEGSKCPCLRDNYTGKYFNISNRDALVVVWAVQFVAKKLGARLKKESVIVSAVWRCKGERGQYGTCRKEA